MTDTITDLPLALAGVACLATLPGTGVTSARTARARTRLAPGSAGRAATATRLPVRRRWAA